MRLPDATPVEWVLGFLLILAAVSVIVQRKPIYASLSFLLTLFLVATLYLQLSAEFIAVMQILVYAGAILVIFVFVMVLFQDAYQKIVLNKSESSLLLLSMASLLFMTAFVFFGSQLLDSNALPKELPEGFGGVHSLGKLLYIDFFFPFEAIVILFLVAIVGAFYIAKKER